MYEAFDEVSRRQVALKVIRTEVLVGRGHQRIQDEFRRIAALDHPQIARAYDFGYSEDGGVPFYTREYIEGVPLPPGPPAGLRPSEALGPLVDLLDALAYVHEQGLVHLDIHAGNLILADDQRRGGVLIDLGLISSFDARRTSLDEWPALPPEMLEEGELTPATDLYMVGRLLLYRLNGQTSGKPRLPKEIPGWGTRRTLEFERIVEKSIRPTASHRFASAGEFRSALLRVIGEGAGRSSKSEPHRSVLGRDVELAALDATLREARDGLCSMTWLAAKAGMGKSRLLAETRVRSQLLGLHTVEVCFSAAPGPQSRLAQALRHAPAGRRGESTRPDLLDPRVGGSPAERVERCAVDYFCQEAPPLVLILDDLERADRESALLVEALARECRRRRSGGIPGRALALVAASTEKPAWPRRGGAKAGVRVRVLRPLPRADARRLFVSLMGALAPPDTLVEEVVTRARGSPLAIRQIAMALREEWKQRRTIPGTATLPASMPGIGDARLRDWKQLSAADRKVLDVLEVIGRPASREELCAALDCPGAEVASGLRRLISFEAVTPLKYGRRRSYQLAHPPGRGGIGGSPSNPWARGVHERLIAHLRARARLSHIDHENLARHLLALDLRDEAFSETLEASRTLRAGGHLDRAVRLLEDAVAHERRHARRLDLIEELSATLAELGNHQRGIALLEPFFDGPNAIRRGARRVRVGRDLGVHYHRAGSPQRALEVFEETRRAADPRRDLEALVLIDSELAELHIFQNDHDAAERACRRGLARLDRSKAVDGRFRGRMEVMLRASLGHIQLRRHRLAAAREELTRALTLSRRHSSFGDCAAILHNLGVTENHSSRFDAAQRHFLEAERLLRRAGERSNLIKISTNLVLIAAKLGDRDAAMRHLDRARDLLRHHPGRRLECFFAYGRGVAALLLGDCDVAIDSCREAVAAARELGDSSIESFGRIAIGEACLYTGRLTRSLTELAAVTRAARHVDPSGMVERMALARSVLVESLLCRKRRLAKVLDRYRALPRGDVPYLEAWNDLFVGLGLLVRGESPRLLLEAARQAFRELAVPLGERLALLGLLAHALGKGDREAIARLLAKLVQLPVTSQRFLEVAEPVVQAEAHFVLGDDESMSRELARASAAMVGSSFLEADWRLEALRARGAARRGELAEARRHLHRCVHLRDLLLQFVPGECRERFVSHSRFDVLRQLDQRLARSPRIEHSTERLRQAEGAGGMVGRSAPMVALFQTMSRLRDQEIPVLVTGETGVGKELVARGLHAHSPRSEGPMKLIHCACLPSELFESELFGHVAGAFTGADMDAPGLLEDADGGTVLLDEIAHLPLESQAKLLAVLDSGMIRKLGAVRAQQVDVRFIATSAVDLAHAVAEGRFREDLFYRLGAVSMEVPPLRERREDIPLLARHLLERHARRLDRPVVTLEDDAAEALCEYDWPGNVRQLENFLLRAVVSLSPGECMTRRELEPLLARQRAAGRPAPSPLGNLLDRSLWDRRRELEREYLTQLFVKVGGDVRQMARVLQVKSTKLYEWLRKLGIDTRALRRSLR